MGPFARFAVGWLLFAPRAAPVLCGRPDQLQPPTCERKLAADGCARKRDSHRRNVPMRYTRLLAALLFALGATQCLAETPDWSQNSPQAMSIMQRTGLLKGPNWWSRYGEPVNAEALAQADGSPS